jgi:Gram-negative bacterial TonB protein C-terminal/PilZ domain
MGAGASPQRWEQPSRRRRLRYRVQAPLDVTVLRSGIPDTLPGRAVNLGEGGVAAVLAGELMPGEAVGVEIRLPRVATPVRTRALVRHHDKLCSGMEFVGMSAEQQSAIRGWAQETKADATLQAKNPIHPPKGAGIPPSPLTQHQVSKRRRHGWIFLLLAAAILSFAFWLHWSRSWKDLESGLPGSENTTVQAEAHVPAAVMEKLVIHRVDPDYPAAARPEKLQAVILLDVIIGREGSVVETHALNGPEVLAQAAESALRWWRFEPYLVNGKPAVVETTVAVEFKP